MLNKRVEINDNEHDDPESVHYKNRPYELLYLNKKDSDTYDWRKFISEEDATILDKFERPRKMSKKLLKEFKESDIDNAADKISEWICQKVLVEAK